MTEPRRCRMELQCTQCGAEIIRIFTMGEDVPYPEDQLCPNCKEQNAAIDREQP